MWPYGNIYNFRRWLDKPFFGGGLKSISEIALQCGFSDVYSFSHSFKKHKNIVAKEKTKIRGIARQRKGVSRETN